MLSKKIEDEFETLTDGGTEIENDSDTDTDTDTESTEPDLDAAKKQMYPDNEKDTEETEAEKKEAEKSREDENDNEDEKDEDKDDTDDSPKAVTAEDLKFPEGVQVDGKITEKFLNIINNKDMKPKEVADELVALQTDLYKAQLGVHQAKMDGWIDKVSSDVKFVGDTGDKLDENLALAKKGMEALKIEGLSKYLDDSGEGNNPLFVEAFMKVGKSISEDTFMIGGGSKGATDKEAKDVLYPQKA